MANGYATFRLVIFTIVTLVFGIILATNANAVQVGSQARTYTLNHALDNSYPIRLRLTHCGRTPQEDDLARLKMVDYRPSDGIVVYRCMAH